MKGAAAVAIIASFDDAAPLHPVPSPLELGSCAFINIQRGTQRLGSGTIGGTDPGSHTTVALANGVSGISSHRAHAMKQPRAGDHVMTCLAEDSQHCPAGDARERPYTATNLPTDRSRILPDADRRCGGA